ncbi:MerR family transcriptional regulator [Solibacillus daqui]|uniref:MerR family transcriptional regulator n=1 Tax=Solibacillus daqui TaxID=2912187 RepID=UPI002365D403|nr:MerR family transcriptional regulator [Solibacillus daqui]
MYIDEKINMENLQQLISSDLLYKELLKDDHNEEALFPPFIKKLNLTKVYTSEEVSGILNKKDSSIRYYISVLFDYIQPMKQGRNYRYDYISIYRIYLIILFTGSAGRKVNDIKRIFNDTSLDSNVPEFEILKEKVNQVEQNINQLNQIEKIQKEQYSNYISLIKRVDNLEENIEQWNQKQRKIIEIDLRIDEIKNQYFSTMVDILETEMRLLQLDNELFHGIQSLELQNRLYVIEGAVREKNRSLFAKLSSIITDGDDSSSSKIETSLLTVRREFNIEKELLKKLEDEREVIRLELESVNKLKVDILRDS